MGFSHHTQRSISMMSSASSCDGFNGKRSCAVCIHVSSVCPIGKNCIESGYRPLSCAYRINWARRTSLRWWDEWDDIALQTQDSKFKPWRSEVEHATSRSLRLPTILSFTSGWGRNILFLSNRRDRETNSSVKGSSANHYHRSPALVRRWKIVKNISFDWVINQNFPFGNRPLGKQPDILLTLFHHTIVYNVWNRVICWKYFVLDA